MFKKLTDSMNAQKIRAILLLEATFNAMHEITFNNRLILSIEAVNAILIEVIGGRRSQAATYLALDEKTNSWHSEREENPYDKLMRRYYKLL